MIGSLAARKAAPGATPQASFRVPLSAIVQAGEGQYGVYVVYRCAAARRRRSCGRSRSDP